MVKSEFAKPWCFDNLWQKWNDNRWCHKIPPKTYLSIYLTTRSIICVFYCFFVYLWHPKSRFISSENVPRFHMVLKELVQCRCRVPMSSPAWDPRGWWAVWVAKLGWTGILLAFMRSHWPYRQDNFGISNVWSLWWWDWTKVDWSWDSEKIKEYNAILYILMVGWGFVEVSNLCYT